MGNKLQVPEGRGRERLEEEAARGTPFPEPSWNLLFPSAGQEAALSCVNVNFVEGAALPERAAERRDLGEKCLLRKGGPHLSPSQPGSQRWQCPVSA